jgi:parallel beta-helix repeat protein
MNKKAGIAVDDHAYAKIFRNKISNNLHQGILVVENSNAFIEGNHIFQNIKANIACGGDDAQNTVIFP